MSAKASFKVCPACGLEWKSRDDFLDDEGIVVVGYQVHFDNLRAGIFLFNHSCKGTLAIEVGEFEDLYDGPVFTEKATGSDDCPGYCLHKDMLDPCPARCECAFVRQVIRILRKSP